MRQVERWEVSSVEQELAFGVWSREREIKLVLADGDDTLWETIPIFIERMGECAEFLARAGILTRDEWLKEMERINNLLFATYGVNPKKMDMVVEQLGQRGLDGRVQGEAKKILAAIYQTSPEFIEGTEAGLEFLKRTGMPMGIVTHAGREWTWEKYKEWLRLDRFFDWENVFLVDENGHKTKDSWRAAMKYFGVEPENCLVVGDSPKSDINPVNDLGVRYSFLVRNPYGIWSIYQEPIDENKTMSVGSINDLRWLGREVVHRKRG